MNIPNLLTLLRIALAPVFMFFFVIDQFPAKLVGLLLFIVAALTDLADGYLARKFGVTTGFGKFMDPLADKILVSSAFISFIAMNYLSPIPVILIIGREFLITGLRLLAAYRGVVIPPSWGAKLKTFLQMTMVGGVMTYVTLVSGLAYFAVAAPWLSSIDIHFIFAVAIWCTAAITVWTGIDYVIKYFYMVKSVLR